MSRVRCILGSLVVVSAISVPSLSAQTPEESSWASLQQLSTGQRIAIELMNRGRQDGEFLTVVDDAISLRSKGRAITVQRSEVRRVSVRGPSKRLRNTALGALGGAAAGALASGANKGRSERGFVTGMNTLIGIGVGAGIGAALPANRYRTIYLADNRQSR